MSERKYSFEEFKRNEPEKVIIKKAGPEGKDLVLKKVIVNGITAYNAPCEVPSFGLKAIKCSCSE